MKGKREEKALEGAGGKMQVPHVLETAEEKLSCMNFCQANSLKPSRFVNLSIPKVFINAVIRHGMCSGHDQL